MKIKKIDKIRNYVDCDFSYLSESGVIISKLTNQQVRELMIEESVYHANEYLKDLDIGSITFDLNKIKKLGVTDNLALSVYFMMHEIGKLKKEKYENF